MGWNGYEVRLSNLQLSYKDYVEDTRLDMFECAVQDAVEKLVAQMANEEFSTELEANQVNFMVGNQNSYDK